jgi:hypothetical protein
MKKVAKVAASIVLLFALSPMVSLASTLLFVDDSGNVGIGNSSPQHKLDVSGAMYSRLVTLSDSSSLTVDWNSGNMQSLALSTSNTTFTFSNGQAGGEYTLFLNQDSTAGRTVTWPASVKWPNGTPPSLSTSASSTDILTFKFDGTTYFGTSALNYKATSVIAFDAATNCGSNSSCTVTTSGSNRALVAFVHGDTSDNTPTCTYNGSSMTLEDKVQTPSDRWVYGFLLLGPTAGSNTLSCSGPSFIKILAASYTGVKQSGQPDNHATSTASSASSISTSYTVSTANSWVIQNTYAGGGSASSATLDSASMTSRGSILDGGLIFDSTEPVSSGSHTVAWTNSSTSNLSQIIISLVPVSS